MIWRKGSQRDESRSWDLIYVRVWEGFLDVRMFELRFGRCVRACRQKGGGHIPGEERACAKAAGSTAHSGVSNKPCGTEVQKNREQCSMGQYV